MTRAQGLSDFASGLGQVLKVDANNNRIGINSTTPTEALDVVGNIKATGTISGTVNELASDISINTTGIITASKFVGDGSELTGVSGFATALSSNQSSPLNVFFKTPKQVNIGAGTSISVESDATSGNIAFIRESIIHVAVGGTMRVVSGTQLNMNVLGLF